MQNSAIILLFVKGCDSVDVFDRLLELSQEGYFCAQILLILALESEGKECPDLIRSMSGLNGGLGNTGGICGCLTGGACFLSYFTGKGESDELAHPAHDEMISELVSWFKEYTAEYGGITCDHILEHDNRNKLERCPAVISAVLEKCLELLETYGALL